MEMRKSFHQIINRSGAVVPVAVLICLALVATACNPAAETQYPAPPNPSAQTLYPAPVSTLAAGDTPAAQPVENPASGGNAGLPNPASVYCEENGGKLEIRSDASGGQYGVCVFANGSECEEWAFLRKECAPEQPAPTADLVLSQTYHNPVLKFSLAYPEGWRLEEAEDSIRLQRGEYTLFIGFWRSGEQAPLFRTGMPEGEFVESGSFALLGQTLPKNYLVAEGKVKLVDYGFGLEFGDLSLAIWLDGRDQPPATYRERNLPETVIQEAEAILNSMRR